MASQKTTPPTVPPATQQDPKREAIFDCLQAAFNNAGLNPITSALNQIVWTAIPKPVTIKIGTALRKCMKTKLGSDPGDLTGPLIVLSAHAPVMTVATLIEDLLPLVG